MHFSTTDKAPFDSIVTDFTAGIQEPFLLYRRTIPETPYQDPFYPFLDIIRDYFQTTGQNPDLALSKAGVYQPQRCIFRAYLTGSRTERIDIPVLEEIHYEKRQVRRSIFLLLRFIAQHKPLILAISNLRYATAAVLDFVRFLQEEQLDAPILCLYAYDKLQRWEHDPENEQWERFLIGIEESNTIFEIRQENGKPAKKAKPVIKPPVIPEPRALVQMARLNLVFTAFPEALGCAQQAQSALNALSDPESDNLQYSLLNTIGDAHYYMGEPNHALLSYQALTEKAQRDENKKALAKSTRKTGFAYLAFGDIDSAKRFAMLQLKITEKLPEKLHRLYAWYFCFLVSTRNSILIPKEDYFTLLNDLNHPEFSNMHAFVCQQSVSYGAYYGGYQEILLLCDKAIEYYTRNGNEFGLSIALHKKAIIYSNNSMYEDSFVYMKKSHRLRIKIGNSLDIVRIQNGIGYLYYLTANYPKAFTYFKKSLQILLKMHDYDEITATLFNLAMLYIACGYYQRGTVILDKILKIMHILKLIHIPYHTVEDIYVLKAFCAIKTGLTVKALELVNKIRLSGRKLSWRTRFFFTLLQGIIAAENGDLPKADDFFRTALKEASAERDNKKDILPHYYAQYSRVLLAAGQKKRASEILTEGIHFCDSNNYTEHVRSFQLLRDSGSAPEVLCEMGNIQVNLDTLVELAQQEFVLSRLQNKIRDIRFLNIIQTELMQSADRQSVAERLLNLIFYHFPMEISSFHLVGESGTDTLLAQNIPESLGKPDLSLLLRAVAAGREQSVFTASEIRDLIPELSLQLESLVSIPILQNRLPVAYLFLATQKSDVSLTGEDMEILKIASSQISILFEKIHHEEEITRISRQDALSGLHNRQALQTRLREESLRIKRYKNRTEVNFSVAFIDLDNFKYYNDTFGHNIGDLIIVEFSKLLIANFREIDFVARFGGDEFIVIMPETSSAQAAIPLNRIFNALQKARYFTPLIEKQLGEPVCIPEQNLVSCSIGLSGYEYHSGQEDNADLLLQQADKALYDAKSAGKHCLRIWHDTATYPA